jgi:DNA ligase D-like protein (predicted 3'-phosphoesterase)
VSIFVVQEHHASHLHWDFRFEHEGKLKSWAIPREPSNRAGEKRLAIQVEDHDLEWANFEGVIPDGEYGAGRVSIWDKGSCELLLYNPSNKIELILEGRRLKGRFVLLRFKRAGEKMFLFFKARE